ncbi:hypothetical protein ACFDR9_004631, partial [Janthinobacterium sp. CG_23.3]
TADFAALTTLAVAALKSSQLAALTTNQVVALTTAQAGAIGTAQIAGLTTSGIVALETADLAAMRSSAIGALNSDQVLALTTTQVASLTTGQVAALSTASMATGLTTNQVVALSSSQIGALNSAQVAAMSTSTTAAIETRDIAALKTSAIASLRTAQIQALTTDQVSALTSLQIHALSSTQVAAFSTDQIQALQFITPIVIDLDGNGVSTLSMSAGVQFDLKANGSKLNTGWVGQGDGLLVLDRNGDGVINDGRELFGSSTVLANGQKAATGYAAMAELDVNKDGTISAADQGFADLRIWIDGNADGVSQAAELKSLASLNIAQLNLDVAKAGVLDNGNIVGLQSTYNTTDGASHAVGDVWFQTSAVAPAAAPAANMRGRVTDLVQAMASFGEGAASAQPAGAGALKLDGAAHTGAVAASVGAMADALKQFDAFGKALGGSDGLASGEQTLRLNALQNAASHGILAAK